MAYFQLYRQEATPEGLADQVIDTAFLQFLPIGIDETRLALRELLRSEELKNLPLPKAIQEDPEAFNTLLIARYREKVLNSLEDYIGKFIDYIFDDLRRNGTGGLEEKEGQKISEGMIKFLDDLANLDLGEQAMPMVKKKVREKTAPRILINAFHGKLRELLQSHVNLDPAVQVLGNEDAQFRSGKIKTAKTMGSHLDRMLDEIYAMLRKPYEKPSPRAQFSDKPGTMTLIEAVEYKPRMLRVIEGGYPDNEGLQSTSRSSVNGGKRATG